MQYLKWSFLLLKSASIFRAYTYNNVGFVITTSTSLQNYPDVNSPEAAKDLNSFISHSYIHKPDGNYLPMLSPWNCFQVTKHVWKFLWKWKEHWITIHWFVHYLPDIGKYLFAYVRDTWKNKAKDSSTMDIPSSFRDLSQTPDLKWSTCFSLPKCRDYMYEPPYPARKCMYYTYPTKHWRLAQLTLGRQQTKQY